MKSLKPSLTSVFAKVLGRHYTVYNDNVAVSLVNKALPVQPVAAVGASIPASSTSMCEEGCWKMLLNYKKSHNNINPFIPVAGFYHPI